MDVLVNSLTPSQKTICAWLASRSRVLLMSGDIRAGKTLGLILFPIEFYQQYPESHCLILGRSHAALMRNVYPPIRKSCEVLGLKFAKHEGGRRLTVGNCTFHLIGVPNTAALDGIWGSEMAYILIDDATRVVPEAVPTAITRLNLPYSKLAISCNPASANHPLKRDYFDRAAELGAVACHASIRDNPGITEETIKAFERELTGHYKKRNLEGVWAGAAGLIYQDYKVRPLKERNGRCIIGCDWGTTNATAAIVIQEHDNHKWQCVGEYFYNQGDRTLDDHMEAIRTLYIEHDASSVYVDPSAKALKLALNRANIHAPNQSKRAARFSVADGIALVDDAFKDQSLTIAEGTCYNLLDELAAYEWSETATERGEDKPAKVNDHCCDGLRYGGVEVLQRRKWMAGI